MERIIIFTDGGVRNNDKEENIGAWAYIIQVGNERTECYGVELNTKSDIQEMRACIEALKSIDNYDAFVAVHSDSSYLVNGMKKWVKTWKKNNWTRGRNNQKPILHLELWMELYELSCKFSRLRFSKVKAHSSNEGNGRADKLVNIAMNKHKATEQYDHTEL